MIAYLTELEIIQALRLPRKLGRIVMTTWKMQPSFPKPAEGMGGRWFWPEVEQWLMGVHGVGTQTILAGITIPVSGSKGEDFDAFAKARPAGRPKRTGPDLPPPPARLAANVVATIGPDGARLQGQDSQAVAAGRQAGPAD